MGTYEITNDQWNKFTASLGVPVTGSARGLRVQLLTSRVSNVPTDSVSWYEAAQFVNWLNTSTGHQAAYKFTGTQGTSDYTFAAWSSGGCRLRRKQSLPQQGLPSTSCRRKMSGSRRLIGTARRCRPMRRRTGVFRAGQRDKRDGLELLRQRICHQPFGPWDVGSGSQELNGTYDMMGNDWEWMESPYSGASIGAGSSRGFRGGDWNYASGVLAASVRDYVGPTFECSDLGFRVASVPEPGSLVMLAGIALTALLCWWRKRA